jgi:hypothetical protein
VTYKELESVQQLSTASSQDEFFRQPIVLKDLRILMWELQRRSIIIDRISNEDGSLSRKLM